MRIPALILFVPYFLIANFEAADSQLTFGHNGLRLPPINLLTVYRILKRTWNSFTNSQKPPAKNGQKKQEKSKSSARKTVGEMEKKGRAEVGRNNDLPKNESLILADLKQRIIFWCEFENMNCSEKVLEEFLHETNTTLTQEEESVILKYNITESLAIPVEEFTRNIPKNFEIYNNLVIEGNTTAREESSKIGNITSTPEISQEVDGSSPELDNTLEMNTESSTLESSIEMDNDSSTLEKSPNDREYSALESSLEMYGDSSTLEMSPKDTESSALESSPEIDGDSSTIEKSPKIPPSFLPYPFAGGAWVLSWAVLNSVLLGLYLFIAGPYFLTGRTVHIFGYEEPPDSYTFYDMNAIMMENGDDEDDEDDGEEGDDDKEEKGDGYDEDGGDNDDGGDDEDGDDNDDGDDEGGGGDEYDNEHSNNGEEMNEEPYLGYTTYGDSDMIMNYMMNEDKDDEDNEHESGNEYLTGDHYGQDEETECMENIMCLRPVYGARALSATSLALKLLEWIPGATNIGSKFKKNINRLDKAVAKGRYGDCRDYICPKKKKRK